MGSETTHWWVELSSGLPGSQLPPFVRATGETHQVAGLGEGTPYTQVLTSPAPTPDGGVFVGGPGQPVDKGNGKPAASDPTCCLALSKRREKGACLASRERVW